jgi:hypothetical protein
VLRGEVGGVQGGVVDGGRWGSVCRGLKKEKVISKILK